jgi:hypothetical protein
MAFRTDLPAVPAMPSRPCSLGRLLAATLVLALASLPSALSSQEDGEQSGRNDVTWIEQVSPGVFDSSARPPLAEGGVSYQVNATVLIPLLITSIPIINREDVGVGSFAVADFEDSDGGTLRAYEFFAASNPDRARGLNRLGFIREVAKLGSDGTRWTAQFGVISADRAQAQSREDAEQSFEQDQNLQPYKIIDTMIERRRNHGTVTTLILEGRWESADALYADVRPEWATVPPEREHELEDPRGVLYEEPIGFLGAIQLTLRRVATTLAAGNDPPSFSCPYIHKGQVFQMEFLDHKIDRRRQALYLEAGLVRPNTVVHKLEYRVMNDEGDEDESFELWTELPSKNADDPSSPPILPIAFEFKPRAYLALKAVQVPAAR